MKNEISDFYGHDHDDLDGYFKKFQEHKRKDYPLAKEFFKKFKFGLQRHILWEEDILYPVFEEKTRLHDMGPTVAMREEHRQIEQALEQLHKRVQRSDPESDKEEAALWQILKEHNHKEEDVLYPTIDGITSSQERSEVFSKMKNLPEGKYKTCCQLKTNE